ncbi:MAG TPA: transglutaminase-like domain-containing protein [Caldisericia bacterium]|nr:transglutaminase-like domain-containing protein [Caldisericia bacterium]HPF48320.1 transglutaminase-like domain-containing protein [Caldisericia bacterium]HPI83501.1 transglutaminase-like domain-containing protein [Caldisericia bacterium]HPQ92773.1 transglutaminase-like domain-containing protein [Caldisericia bacterium]HRV74129.1 transglutaminase-like domain-containing protein [Caldisericia bacterium]
MFKPYWNEPVGMTRYVLPDECCDFNKSNVSLVVDSILNRPQTPREAFDIIYNFVKENIWFDFYGSIFPRASNVLSLGKGSSIGKSILLVAMARYVKIPARFWAFFINRDVFVELVPQTHIKVLHDKYLHVQPQVWMDSKWMTVESVVYDRKYLDGLLKLYGQSHKAKGLGMNVDATLGSFSKAVQNWDGKGEIECVMSNPKMEIGERIDPTDIVKSTHKKGYLTTMLNKSVSQRIERIRYGF